MRLTASTIRSLTLPPGEVDRVFFDDDMPGLGLRLRVGGAKTWLLQYAVAGKTRRMTLGSIAVLDPGKARETAKDLLAQVRLGRDPAHEKVSARLKAAETFGALLPR
jgi:Arm DNA-binding domain